MSPLVGRHWRRLLLSQGVRAAVVALAVSPALADVPLPAHDFFPSERAGGLPTLSPEAPRFVSAGSDDRDSTVSPKAPDRAAPDRPPLVVYDPTAGPSLSPMQSALHAAIGRLVTRNDRLNPLGGRDGGPRAGRSRSSMRRALMRRYGSARMA